MNIVLCDTSVFVATKENEPSLQKIPTESFFESTVACHYTILSLEVTVIEIEKKFKYHLDWYYGLIRRLEDLGKHSLIKIGAAHKRDILQIFNDKQIADYDLSFEDCAMLYFAQKNNCCLAAWDSNLIDAGNCKGLETARPDEL